MADDDVRSRQAEAELFARLEAEMAPPRLRRRLTLTQAAMITVLGGTAIVIGLATAPIVAAGGWLVATLAVTSAVEQVADQVRVRLRRDWIWRLASRVDPDTLAPRARRR